MHSLTAPAHTLRQALSHDLQASAWEDLRSAWLESKRGKSGSVHTLKAYSLDYADFFSFSGKAPWLVTQSDAHAWLAHLTAAGKAPATANRKLAVLSSFYAFVIEESTRPVHDMVEHVLYVDGQGDPLPNPFSRPERHPVAAYSTARALTPQAVRSCLSRINRKTLTGARDFALITTYLFTGRLSAEIANLRWQDIDTHAHRSRVYYTWTGRGGQSRTDELPPPAWQAIRSYLHVTGRLGTMLPTDYIFRALFADRATRLPNVFVSEPNRPLSASMISRIVKRRFAAVGINPEEVHTHTLRHTAAALRFNDGRGQDIVDISALLNHSSLTVTQRYLTQPRRPIDCGWTEVEQLLFR